MWLAFESLRRFLRPLKTSSRNSWEHTSFLGNRNYWRGVMDIIATYQLHDQSLIDCCVVFHVPERILWHLLRQVFFKKKNYKNFFFKGLRTGDAHTSLSHPLTTSKTLPPQFEALSWTYQAASVGSVSKCAYQFMQAVEIQEENLDFRLWRFQEVQVINSKIAFRKHLQYSNHHIQNLLDLLLQYWQKWGFKPSKTRN